MRRKSIWYRAVSLGVVTMLALPLPSIAQTLDVPPGQANPQQKKFSSEELAQIIAPIALYPDELVSQILMASTYPLEIVEADRWVQKYRDLTGDALARALEGQKWDPSVKSLVNFPSVLSMMSQKLDVTARLGDAFLAQEQEVMDMIQTLRKRAADAGNLQSSPEQKVVVEKETIIIQPANPEVIYVPTYNPSVVYGTWMYPAYPPYPYYYYPPPLYGYYGFAAGVTIGLAWGYAWGGCNWGYRSVNVNVYRNVNVNNAYINRNNYVTHYQSRGIVGQNGQGNWKHDPSHRRGVAYRDGATARQYGQPPGRVSPSSRDVRGYGDSGRGSGAAPMSRPDRGGADQNPKNMAGRPAAGVTVPENRRHVSPSAGRPDTRATTPASRDSVTAPGGGNVPSGTSRNLPSGGGNRAVATPVPVKRDSAFSGEYNNGENTRSASDRGRFSRSTPAAPGGYGGGAPFGSGGYSGNPGGGYSGGHGGGYSGGHGGGNSGGQGGGMRR